MSRRRPPVALLLFTFHISPLCDVAQTSDCGILVTLNFGISPLWGVAQTPNWGMSFISYLSRRRFRHPIGLLLILLGLREDYRPTSFLFSCSAYLMFVCALLTCSCASCLHLLYLMSKLFASTFKVLTGFAPGYCFGQMLTKAILWMKSTIASPTPRGVPVSLLRSWSCPLYYIRFRHPNKYIKPHTDAWWAVR